MMLERYTLHLSQQFYTLHEYTICISKVLILDYYKVFKKKTCLYKKQN